MPPPHLTSPPPPSPTVICVSSVTILLMSCVSCKAMIVFSSLQDGRSSLMLASWNGHHEVVKMLLLAGAKFDLRDNVSTTNARWWPVPWCDSVQWTRRICAHHCIGDYLSVFISSGWTVITDVGILEWTPWGCEDVVISLCQCWFTG